MGEAAAAVTAGRTEVLVPARDGTPLALSVWVPDTRPVATFLRITRYPPGPIDDAQDDAVRDAGFAVVVARERGSGGSGGHRPLPWSPVNEGDAGAVIEWIGRQPWSDGSVAAWGMSYDGGLAEAAGASGAPGLRAVAPLFIGADPYADIVYPGGLFNEWFVGNWTSWNAGGGVHCDEPRRAEADPGTYAAVVAAPHRDDPIGDASYAAIGGLARAAAIERAGVAVFAMAGWFDSGFARGALERFVTGRGSQVLVIGPWNHGATAVTDPLRPGPGGDPGGEAELRALLGAIAEELGRGAGERPVRSLRFYTLGAGTWRETRSWPPPGVEPVALHLAAGGALALDPPAPGAAPTRHEVFGSATSGELCRWHTTMCGWPVDYGDRRAADEPLLTFDSPPLARAATITGSPWARLWLAADHTDAAVFAYLEAVAPDGRVAYLTEGMLRARHRATRGLSALGPVRSFARGDAAPLEPGVPTALDVALVPISVELPAGHRLRLAIAGADRGTFAPLPGGEPSTFTVHHDRARASAIHLPVEGGAPCIRFASAS